MERGNIKNMSEICTTCGLPKELCVCETIAKESQKIIVKTEKKKFGKVYTVIEGIDTKEIDTKDLIKKLKSRFACGGAVKNSVFELQGDHKRNVRDFLEEMGFASQTIEVR